MGAIIVRLDILKTISNLPKVTLVATVQESRLKVQFLNLGRFNPSLPWCPNLGDHHYLPGEILRNADFWASS